MLKILGIKPCKVRTSHIFIYQPTNRFICALFVVSGLQHTTHKTMSTANAISCCQYENYLHFFSINKFNAGELVLIVASNPEISYPEASSPDAS